MNALPLPGDGPERLLEHAEALRRLARRLVRDDAEADDLVQETWTSVLEKPREHEPAAGWKRWLFGVARNLARERRRSEGRRTRREQTAARPESTTEGVEIVEQLETFRMLADELSRLEEPYRSTLYRRFFEGRTNAEIAADDAVAEPSVRSRASRGLALLRERIERREPDKRGSWIVLLRRIAREEPTHTPLIALPLLILTSAIALLAVVIVIVLVQTHTSKSNPIEQTALAPRTDRPATTENSLVDPRSEDSAGSTRITITSASPRERASLHLVDLRTHEPLAGFALRVGVLTTTSNALTTSHADGSVDLPIAHGTFDLALTLIDDPALDALRRAHSGARSFPWTLPPVHFAPGAEACTLGIAVGPSFSLRISPPLPIETLHAEILASDRGSLRAASTAPLRAPLEPNGTIWVRFLDEAAYLGGAPPYLLRVTDDTGYLGGETEVTTLVGASPQPLTILLEPRGSLHVDARCAQGRPLDARIVLSHANHILARTHSDTDGATFTNLPEGDYEVRLESAEFDTVQSPTHVTPSKTTDLTFAALCRPTVGSIAGRAHSNTKPLRFEIENSSTNEQREIIGTLDGEDTTFEFRDVPAGSWTLRAHASGIWRWKPAQLEVSAPSTGLLFTPITLAPTDVRAIKIRAFDADTGERIDHFLAQLQCDGSDGEQQTKTTGFGNLVFESVPTNAPLSWSVTAEGYRTARGDRANFERPGDMDLLRVRLQRGWQRDVEARDAATHNPLSNARVLLDGVLAGTTNAHGLLRLDRASPPRKIVVELDGYTLTGGSIELDGTWSTDDSTKLTAQMRATH